MQVPIPRMKKRQVIALWLRGHNYRKIANTARVATGSASNIIADYLAKLGSEDVDEVRWLVQEMKRAGIMPEQCATGARLVNILNRLGIDVNDADFASY